MSKAYLEVIENFLSSELSVGFDATALGAVAELTEDQFQMFSEHWHGVDQVQHELMTQARPFQSDATEIELPTGMRQKEDAKEVTPTSALFAHPYNSLLSLDLDLVKRQALLFSRVAVIAPRLGFGREPATLRAEFAKHLQSMLDLKPIVEDGTVELIPVAGFYSDEIEGGAGIVRAACKDDPAIQRWIASQKDQLDDFSRTARPGDPFFDAGIRICAALNYGHTLAATHPFVGGLYKQLLTDTPRQDRSLIAATNLLRRIELPGFANLAWKDIKSLRDNEECLAIWRADLQVAITSVDPDLPPDKFVERFDSQVQAQLRRAALDLDKSLKRSTAAGRFKKGTSSLILSAVATAARLVAAPHTILWPEIASVFRKDGPREALRLIWERRDLTGKRALRNHYAVFSTSDG
jgi:hypothetical protein